MTQNAFTKAITQPKPKQPPITGSAKHGSKFTAALDSETTMAFDKLALTLRGQLGRQVTKVEIVRVLIMLAGDGPELRARLLEELRER